MSKPRFIPPKMCPVCGEDVPRNARACPECGADERSGWSDDAGHDGIDLPEEGFDYDEFVRSEFGHGKLRQPAIGWFWWVIALIVLLATAVLLFHR